MKRESTLSVQSEKPPPDAGWREREASQAKHRGAGRRPASDQSPSTVSGRRKIFAKKKGEILCNFTEADVDREVRALEGLLKEEGLINQVCSGREAAFASLVDDELCLKLTGKFACQSAEKTGEHVGDIGSIRDSYERIVTELLCVGEVQSSDQRQSLSSVLRSDYETDEALKQFLPKLGKWIDDYVSHCIRGERDQRWTLRASPRQPRFDDCTCGGIRQRSKWLNAISVGGVQTLAKNPCAW